MLRVFKGYVKFIICSNTKRGQVPKHNICQKCCVLVPDPNEFAFSGDTNAGLSEPGYLLHEGIAHFFTLGDVVFGDFSGNVSDAADIPGSFGDTDCLAGVEQVKGV